MKQMRRLLALLLALTMVLGMFPAAVAQEAAEAATVLMEELPEIEVADDQELLVYLEDGEAQKLLVREEMTLTLARDLESNDEVSWAEDGLLRVEGAILTCAAIDMMAFSEEELAEAMGKAPFCNMDASCRNIWVFEGVNLAGVELPANRTLSWVAPLREDNVIDGTWPALQTLFVPMEAGLTVQTDLSVENAVIVNGALFLENGAELTANMISGTGSCWWSVNETVNCENIECVIYPHGNEYEAPNGAQLVDVYDVPSLLYYLTDGVQQEVNVSADLRLPVETDIVSEDGLYANFRFEDDESGRRGNLYRLEVLGEGTLTVADLGLAVWEQEQLDAAIAGDYPIQVSEGGHTNLFLEGEFRIDETTVLPSMTSFLFGVHSSLTLAEGVRLTSEAGLWNVNYGEGLADLNKDITLKHNALIDAVYYNAEKDASVRVYYMSEQDFLNDWAVKKAEYPLLEMVLVSADGGGFDLTGDWTIGELGEIVAQDGTAVNIKSTAKVNAGALYVYNPQDTDVCLLTVESGAAVHVDYLNVEASAWWPADVEIFFDSADIRYYAPMLFFRVLGWDDGRQVHVDDPAYGAYSEWPLRVSPVQEKVGYVAYCYPAVEGVPAGEADWSYGPLDAGQMDMTSNLEFSLLEEEFRDEQTVPWCSYRVRTSEWTSSAEEGIDASYTEGGYTMPLHIYSGLETIGFFTAPTRSEEYAVGQLNCDTFGTTQEEFYLIFQPEYDGQYVDSVKVLNGAATVTKTADTNIWKITVTGSESFSLDLCLYVGDEYSEPWEWHHGIWVECGTVDMENVEVSTAEELLAYLKDGKPQALGIAADIALSLSGDLSSADCIGSYNDANGSHYQVKVTGGTLSVAEFDAVVNTAAEWQAAVDGKLNVNAEHLHIYVNDAFTVSESADLGDTTIHFAANADMTLAPGVSISSHFTYWNVGYPDYPELAKGLTLKHRALVDAMYYKEDGSGLRAFYADAETFLTDLEAKRAEGYALDILFLGTDDGNGNYGSIELDEAWSAISGTPILNVLDGTTLTISTDMEFRELYVNDADDASTREGIAVTVTNGAALTVHDYAYIEGDLAYEADCAVNFYGGVDITGTQPGLQAMWLDWNEELQGQVESENTTTYLGRLLPVNEHSVMFFVQLYENGEWVRTPVIPQAEGVEIREISEEAAAGQENGDFFVRIRPYDMFCEYTFAAELNGTTYTMRGGSYPNEVEYFSVPWDDYGALLDGVALSPVEDTEIYAVVTNGDLRWSNVELMAGGEIASMEDTDDYNVKKITIKAETVRRMREEGRTNVDLAVRYDVSYPDGFEESDHAMGIGAWVDNGMVFVPGGEVPANTVEFSALTSYQMFMGIAPRDEAVGVLYFIWYNDQTGKWVADPYTGECLWQEGDSVSLSTNDAGQTVITGVHGGETSIHHTGFDENGNPNEGGNWHGVPFRVNVGKNVDVVSVDELKAALDDETVTDISVHTNLTVTEDLYVNKPLYIGETGHISVEGNAVLTLEEPGFWDCAENNVDYWLMFMDFPDDVRTCYFCGNQQAAQEMAAVFEGDVAGMHTDIVAEDLEGTRRIVFDSSWPALHIGDSFLWSGNVYVIDGADLNFDRLWSQGHGVSDDTPVNEMSTMVEGRSGSLAVTESLILRGNAYWTPEFRVNLPGDCDILGAYPHLAYRWLENDGRGWFEQTENRMDTHMGSISRDENRFLVFYATVPQVENGAITWTTGPVQVTDGREGESSAVALVKDVEPENIGGGDLTNLDYFTRIEAQSYQWDTVIQLRETATDYSFGMDIPVCLPELGFFSEPEYSTEHYLGDIRLSENPEENVFYLIAKASENENCWVDDLEFVEGGDRIHVEDLGGGIFKLTLQDWVDVYEGFHLHARVHWRDHEGHGWGNGRGLWIEGAENTAPYLSAAWLSNRGDGWYMESNSFQYQNTDIVSPWWEEQFVMFFRNTYNAETGEWFRDAVEVEMDRDDVADLIAMYGKEEYPIRDDALHGGRYFYNIRPYENIWDETVHLTYTMEDGTVLSMPFYVGRQELGFYSDANICNENYITNYDLKPGGENVLYLGIDIPMNEDGSSAYHVVDVWVEENEHMVDSLWRLSDRLWQIRLTEDASWATEGFSLHFRTELEYPDGGRGYWGTGIWCGMGNMLENADASFEINGSTYLFFEGTDAVIKHYFTGETWESVRLDAMDVEGFSYDVSSNTITLTDAELESLYLHYWRGWHDENGDVHIEGYNLPNADVTMVLSGDSSITSVDTSALGVNSGTKLTIVGGGTLTLTAGNTGELYYGNPAIAMWGGGSLTITDNATVNAETRDYGKERDYDGNLIPDGHVFGIVAIQGDYNMRSALTVSGSAKLTISGTRGGMESVSTVTFKDHAEVTSQEIIVNGEPSLRPSMTVTDHANVTVTAVPREHYEHALHFIEGGRLYMKGGKLTVDNTALSQPECALGFESHMGGLKGGLQMTGGELIVCAAGGTGIGLSRGNTYEQHGGTVNVTVGADSPEYWGSWGMTTDPRTEVIMTAGTATFTGTQCDDCNSAGILYRSNNGTIAGGSLNCYGVHNGGSEVINGLYVSTGSLSITGGTHTFKVIVSDGSDDFTVRGIGVLVQENGYLAFTGGSTRAAGYGTVWNFGAENHVTLGKNIHAVSNESGHELNMVYYEDIYTDENGTWTDQIHWFEEDNLVTYPEGDEPYDESQLSHDVTISSAAGETVVNAATIDLAVTNGAPALGAKMSVRAIISIIEGGKARVDVKLPVDMKLLDGSIYLGEQPVESLTGIEISGPAVLRFDAVPMSEYEQSISLNVYTDAQQSIGQASYRFVPGEFDASAPSHVESSFVTITGKAHPGYTVKVSDVHNNVASATVNELGYYSVQFSALREGENHLHIYLDNTHMKEIVVNYKKTDVNIQSLTIRNNVHNSYGETVEEFVEIVYPGGKPTRTFYTYWPGQDIFTLEVNIPGAPENMVLKVIITDYDGVEHEVILTEIRDGFYKGYYLNEDPDSPPVGFEVHWLRIINEKVEDEGHTVKTELTPIMDPSGFVYEDVESNRVEGATVTLRYYESETQPSKDEYGEPWNAEAYGQINGYQTNVNGEFKWDVPKGWWRVQVDKTGYETTYSEWMQVPPPQLGVTIDIGPSRLDENKITLYDNVQITNDGHQAVISFAQPVLFHQVENVLVVTDAHGSVIDGEVRMGKLLSQDSKGNTVKQVIFSAYEPMSSVQVSFAATAGSGFNKEVTASGAYQAMSITNVVKQGDKAGVTLNYGSRSVGMDTLVVASYAANGQFLSLTTTNAVNGKNEVTCDANAATLKAFVVESMETMLPLCQAANN